VGRDASSGLAEATLGAPFQGASVSWHVVQGRSARAFIFIPFGDGGGASSALNTPVHELAIDIGAMPILVRTDSREFACLLEGESPSSVR
jgi:hypothetical protein